jgi:hypothetical protein
MSGANSNDVRTLLALSHAESMTTYRGVTGPAALYSACKQHQVDPLQLAEVWLQKLVGCQQAREDALSLQAGDAEA